MSGWIRLWIVASVVWGAIVLAMVWPTWSSYEMSGYAIGRELKENFPQSYEFAATARSMSCENEAVRPAWCDDTVVDKWEEYSLADPFGEGPPGTAYTVGEEIRDLLDTEGRLGYTPAGPAYREFLAAVQSVRQTDRIKRAGAMTLFWLVPALLALVAGYAVAWVIRGFRSNDA